MISAAPSVPITRMASTAIAMPMNQTMDSPTVMMTSAVDLLWSIDPRDGQCQGGMSGWSLLFEPKHHFSLVLFDHHQAQGAT